MAKIKILIFLAFLVFSTSIYAQNTDLLFTKTDLSKGFNAYNYTLDLKNINFPKNNLRLSLYNETTKLNDIYFISNDSLIYSKSRMRFGNYFGENEIDSYNPHGVDDICSAIIYGLIGTILRQN